jgi:OFA family oxalate/formate antiporter-like MFS transporter
VRRYIVLAASLAIQVCLGGVYAWSEFVPPLTEEHGLTTVQTQAVFGTTIAVFTIAMVFAGRLQERHGPRLVAAAGGVLFLVGYAVAWASGASFAGLLAGIGVLAGAGIGFGYVCPLATCMKWFPGRRGFVTGVTVAGFGAGAIVLANAANALFEAGWAVPPVLLAVGLVCGSVILLAAALLFTPARPEGHVDSPHPAFADLARQRAFWALVVGMFAGTFAGLLVIGNLKPMGLAEGVGASAATWAISAFAVGNALGRITWGVLSDRFGGVTMPASLLVLAAAVAALGVATGPASFVLLAAVTGFGFGSCFVVYAARVAALYGVHLVGAIYPLVFLAYGLSGITGPVVGGWLYDSSGTYLVATYSAALLAAAGAVAAGSLARRRPEPLTA